MKAANRVVFNTGVVYVKLFLSIIAGLLTIRLVLSALGETNYGIYSLVAGISGMLAFLNATMSHASKRFIAHSLGTGDSTLVNKTFNTSFLVHLILAFVIAVFMLVLGYIMFEHILNIPSDKVYDARLVFLFMVISMFVSVITVPFESSMRAHENFLALSLIELLGVFMHLGIAIYLTYANTNLLITYGFLLLISQVIVRGIKQIYSRSKYKECRAGLIRNIDKTVIKKMLSFSGWTLLSSSGSIINQQAKSVLLNMFFGVALNAANGITKKVTQKLNMVVVGLTEAINPQIVKSEGSGNRKKMLNLTFVAAKFSVFLFAIFAIPVYIELPYLLNLWLETVPEYVVIFCRLFLLQMIITKFTYSLERAFRAIGKIREVSITEAITKFSVIPVAYFCFRIGMPPPTIFIVSIFFSFIMAVIRLYYGKKIAGINVIDYLKKVFLKATVPVILSICMSTIPMLVMEEGFFRLIFTLVLSMAASLVLIRFLGLTQEEYIKIKDVAGDGLRKIKRISFF